jgi:hypothetical protein
MTTLASLTAAESTLASTIHQTAAAVRSMGSPVAAALADLAAAVEERRAAFDHDMGTVAAILGGAVSDYAQAAATLMESLTPNPVLPSVAPLLGVAAQSESASEETVATAACSPVDLPAALVPAPINEETANFIAGGIIDLTAPDTAETPNQRPCPVCGRATTILANGGLAMHGPGVNGALLCAGSYPDFAQFTAEVVEAAEPAKPARKSRRKGGK